MQEILSEWGTNLQPVGKIWDTVLKLENDLNKRKLYEEVEIVQEPKNIREIKSPLWTWKQFRNEEKV